jgi:hypothetical protein
MSAVPGVFDLHPLAVAALGPAAPLAAAAPAGLGFGMSDFTAGLCRIRDGTGSMRDGVCRVCERVVGAGKRARQLLRRRRPEEYPDEGVRVQAFWKLLEDTETDAEAPMLKAEWQARTSTLGGNSLQCKSISCTEGLISLVTFTRYPPLHL